jgi:hypothetical protein
MEPSRPGLAENVRVFLRRDHARLEGLLDRFRDEPGGDGSPVLRARWRDFGAAFLGHMAAEEKHLFPKFGRVHPREEAMLRAQHAELRRLLAAAGLSLQARSAALTAFTSALWDHAGREDLMLYEWAERTERRTAEDLIRDISVRAGGADLMQRR